MLPETATIISSLIAAATTGGAGIAQNQALKGAKEESYDLAMLARGDDLKQKATENKFQKQALTLSENKFGYEKRLNREVANKQAVANLGSSLKSLTKSGMDMQSFINSLYGNKG